MSDLRKFAKQWITSNCCDGEDRSSVEADEHIFDSADLYGLIDELLEDYEDQKGDDWVSVSEKLPRCNVHVWIKTEELGVVKGVMIGLFYFDSVDGSFTPDDITVSHWMPSYVPPAPTK